MHLFFPSQSCLHEFRTNSSAINARRLDCFFSRPEKIGWAKPGNEARPQFRTEDPVINRLVVLSICVSFPGDHSDIKCSSKHSNPNSKLLLKGTIVVYFPTKTAMSPQRALSALRSLLHTARFLLYGTQSVKIGRLDFAPRPSRLLIVLSMSFSREDWCKLGLEAPFTSREVA